MGLFGGSKSQSNTTYDQNTQGDNSTGAAGSGNNVSNINSGGAPAINLGGATVSAPITFSDYGSVQGALTLAQHVADQSASIASSANSALADQASGGANQNQRTLVLIGIAAIVGAVVVAFIKSKG